MEIDGKILEELANRMKNDGKRTIQQENANYLKRAEKQPFADVIYNPETNRIERIY